VTYFFIKQFIMQRVTFYVDGFNFYYALRASKKVDKVWLSYYWIDFVKLFSQFLGPDQILEKVIYFSASQLSADKSSRQGTLFNANKLINGDKFEIVRGKYISKPLVCPACHYSYNKPEEKRTDVNISVRMLEDCFLDKTDILALVSADSDLLPPLESIANLHKEKNLRVYFPPGYYCNDLNTFVARRKKKVILLKSNENKFRNSIMPDVVKSEDNSKSYTIPSKWKISPKSIPESP
jgi:uncharacterized LabA/DUF88 family protein